MKKEYSLKSPNYPQLYPLNVECVSVLEAPSENMVINVEFIEQFHIEVSKNCSNDFLEVNDGPFGFSTIIHRYCGRENSRPEFTSSGRYLWLRFFSDNTITETGFKLLYRFIEKEASEQLRKYCYKKVTIPRGYSAIITDDYIRRHLGISKKLNINECVFDVRVIGNSNIFISLSYSSFSVRKDRNQFIEIYDKVTAKYIRRRQRSYIYIDKNNDFRQSLLKSKRGILRIYFGDISTIMKFQIVLTALVATLEGHSCSDDQFKCRDGYCISHKLICNKNINCPSKDDETCFNGTHFKEGDLMLQISTMDPNTVKRTTDLIQGAIVNNKFHGIILGGIGFLLTTLLLICVVHSIKQSRRSSSFGRSQNSIKEERIHSLKSSAITLTTGEFTKKRYNQYDGSPQQNKKSFLEYPLSIWENKGSSDSLYQPRFLLHPKRTSYIDVLDKFDKSLVSDISNVKFESTLGGLIVCKSLPNVVDSKRYLTASVPKLFYDFKNPTPFLVDDKPTIKKYYA